MGREVGSLEKYLFLASDSVHKTTHNPRLLQLVMERGRNADTSERANLPVHGELHLLFVIWYWRVDFFQLQSKLRFYVPAKRGAEEAGSKIVVTILRIAEHAGEVFRNIL